MLPKNWCNRAVFCVGLFSTLSGLFITISWSAIFESFWKNNLVLRPGSWSYKLWIRTPMPLYLELYLFNWTNSNEFIQDTRVKPSFTEVGPFVFKEIHEKVNITFNSSDFIIYNQTRTWIFLPEKSINLSTQVTNFNLIVFTIAKAVETDKAIHKKLINFFLNHYKEKLIITRSAGEWLFDGINDKLLDLIRKLHFTSTRLDKFGWFYGRNKSSTFDGTFVIKTGKNDIYNLGSLFTWNNHHHTKFFDAECGTVKGTTSEIFAPLKKQQQNLTLFISDFCGPFTLTKAGSTTVHGLDGYRFIGDERVFDNGTHYPETKCFCSSGSCTPSGVRNETLCLGGPLFISFPHFYLADPIYSQSIKGVRPNKSEHEFYLVINPLTGLPLEVRAQLQINVFMEPISSFHMFSTLPKVYVPMMWFRQTIELTSNLAHLSLKVKMFEKLGYGLGCCLLIVGVLTVAIKIFRQIRPQEENLHEKEPLIRSFDEPDDGSKNSGDEELNI